MKDGLVSIVMPAYNCEKYIGETIESILAQSYSHWELLVVDDASSDGTVDIVSEYSNRDSRIRCRRLEVNSGAAVARNTAIELAEGEFIAFCDSDDLWMPQKLKHQLRYMQENGVDFTCTSYEWIDETSARLGRVVNARERVDYNRLLLDCPVGNSSVMYNVGKLGKFFVPNIRKRNDDALWLAMLKSVPYICGIPEVLMLYRLRSGSLSSNKFDVVKYHWHLYREIEHLGLLRSMFHIVYWGVIKVLHLK